MSLLNALAKRLAPVERQARGLPLFTELLRRDVLGS
jgi:hypothetical protein